MPQILFLIKPILTKKSIYLLGQNLIQRQRKPQKRQNTTSMNPRIMFLNRMLKIHIMLIPEGKNGKKQKK